MCSKPQTAGAAISRSSERMLLRVKSAWPTAEALRQACLARHSRISHTQPRLPSIRLTRIEVSNSKFLGPVTLDLNPQYNAVIGGRGTGKSTILEYIRWHSVTNHRAALITLVTSSRISSGAAKALSRAHCFLWALWLTSRFS